MHRFRPPFRRYPLKVWRAYLRSLMPALLVGGGLFFVAVLFFGYLVRGVRQYEESGFGLVPPTSANGKRVLIALGDENVWLVPPAGFARVNDALKARMARVMERTEPTMDVQMVCCPCPKLTTPVPKLLPEPTTAFPLAFVTVTKSGKQRTFSEAAFQRVHDFVMLKASVPAAMTTSFQQNPARVAAAQRLAHSGISMDLSRVHRERQNLLMAGKDVVLMDTGLSGFTMHYGWGKTLAPHGELYEVIGVAHLNHRVVYFTYIDDCVTDADWQAARTTAKNWVFHTMDENGVSHAR